MFDTSALLGAGLILTVIAVEIFLYGRITWYALACTVGIALVLTNTFNWLSMGSYCVLLVIASILDRHDDGPGNKWRNGKRKVKETVADVLGKKIPELKPLYVGSV